jgi:hypothetical protein
MFTFRLDGRCDEEYEILFRAIQRREEISLYLQSNVSFHSEKTKKKFEKALNDIYVNTFVCTVGDATDYGFVYDLLKNGRIGKLTFTYMADSKLVVCEEFLRHANLLRSLELNLGWRNFGFHSLGGYPLENLRQLLLATPEILNTDAFFENLPPNLEELYIKGVHTFSGLTGKTSMNTRLEILNFQYVNVPWSFNFVDLISSFRGLVDLAFDTCHHQYNVWDSFNYFFSSLQKKCLKLNLLELDVKLGDTRRFFSDYFPPIAKYVKTHPNLSIFKCVTESPLINSYMFHLGVWSQDKYRRKMLAIAAANTIPRIGWDTNVPVRMLSTDLLRMVHSTLSNREVLLNQLHCAIKKMLEDGTFGELFDSDED